MISVLGVGAAEHFNGCLQILLNFKFNQDFHYNRRLTHSIICALLGLHNFTGSGLQRAKRRKINCSCVSGCSLKLSLFTLPSLILIQRSVRRSCVFDVTKLVVSRFQCISNYRSGTVNSKSFVGKVFLRIKRKFELTYAL